MKYHLVFDTGHGVRGPLLISDPTWTPFMVNGVKFSCYSEDLNCRLGFLASTIRYFQLTNV